MTIKYTTTFYTGNQKFSSKEEFFVYAQHLSLLDSVIAQLLAIQSKIFAGKLDGVVVTGITVIDPSTFSYSIEYQDAEKEAAILGNLKQLNLFLGWSDDALEDTSNPDYLTYFHALGWKIKKQKYIDNVLIQENIFEGHY